jgi:type II secretory pathway pseudopilin PulG
MTRRFLRAGRAAGFTVLELLIVIGVIVLLMALVLYGVEKARHQAYVAKCASNLAQIGQALTAYANENRGTSPRMVCVPGAGPAKRTHPAAWEEAGGTRGGE